MKKTIQVNLLADVPEHGETAMRWIFHEFGARPGRTVDDVIKTAHHFMNRDELPIMFIASMYNIPVGCVILRCNDLKGCEHFTPWLASLYVHPDYRGIGIASRLEGKLVEKASSHGYKRLYLFTPNVAHIYERLGWKIIEVLFQDKKSIYVMHKNLNSMFLDKQ